MIFTRSNLADICNIATVNIQCSIVSYICINVNIILFNVQELNIDNNKKKDYLNKNKLTSPCHPTINQMRRKEPHSKIQVKNNSFSSCFIEFHLSALLSLSHP